jgi:hypothetical protein
MSQFSYCYFDCRYAERHCGDFHYTECHRAKFRCDGCHIFLL